MKKAWLLLLSAAAVAAAPATPKRPVVDEFHGEKVSEDYRWLEDGKSEEVKAWTRAQNAAARAYLDKIPVRASAKERIAAYYKELLPSYVDVKTRGGRVFAMKFQPPKDQLLLVTLGSPDDLSTEKVIFDPNGKSSHHSVDWYVPSQDGKFVAVAMSEKGSEDGSLYFFETETGKQFGEVVPRVQYPTAGGSAAWTEDGSGVYYTRFPQGDERPKEDLNFYQQIWFHKIGTSPKEDVYVLGKDFPRIAEIHLESDGDRLLATVANGDGGEYAFYLMGPDKKWAQLAKFEDKAVAGVLGPDGSVYLVSRKGAPRGQVLRLRPGETRLARAQLVVEQGQASIEARFHDAGLVATRSKLFVTAIDGGPSQVLVYDHAGKPLGRMPLPEVPSVYEVAPYGEDGALVRVMTYLEPAAWYRYDGAKAVKTAMVTKAPIGFHDAEVRREFAQAKDGMKVPMSIVRRKGKVQPGPVLLYAYGSYGLSQKPRFLGIRQRLWLDAGGAYAVCHARGGGEYGEQWHRAANLHKKQTTVDDFLACARHLIKLGDAAPGSLAIEGGSAGGLLMGAALTQAPELFRAAVIHVGVLDMLRVELHPNGAFNVTEFGTVKDPVQFKALRAISPYHNVKDGRPYPATLILTGEHDGRVDPWHSRKMAARLQAATGSTNPVLLRVSMDSGHGMGTALSETIEEHADVFAFLADQLGLKGQ